MRDRWSLCRDGEGGLKHLPRAGGLGEQPAWLLDCMDILEREYANAKPRPGR